MDLKIDFNTYYRLMGAEQTFPNHREAAREEWNKHPEKHKPIIKWLQKHGPYIGRNPFFFIQDFKVRQNPTQPTFLRGDEGGDLVQVRYNGLFKICTRETQQAFALEYVRDWSPSVD